LKTMQPDKKPVLKKVQKKESVTNLFEGLGDSDLSSFQGFNFTEDELKKLHRRFKKIDTDKSGTLTIDEFLSIPELAVNPLLERIVGVLDTNKDEQIQFEEFISALSTFSSKTDIDGKLKFLFRVYDADDDGFISNGELFLVLKMMVGSNLTDIQLQNIVDKTIIEADEDKDGKLSYQEFVKLITNAEEITDKLTITLH